MSVAITLEGIDVLLTPSHAQHLDFFDSHIEQIKQDGRKIDAVIVASSSDLSFLACKYSQDALKHILKAFPNAKTDIVTQGCLGLYSSVLHFNSDSNIESALVVMIETPPESLQTGLNSSKLGQLNGQKGMLVKPGVGVCHLIKKDRKALTDDDMIIDVSEIITKSDGLNANHVFLKRIVQRIHSLQHEYTSQMVSFEIEADLAKLFMKFLQPELDKLGLGQSWLPSYEQDEFHIFSLKPLVEITQYQENLESTPLILFGLGIGGRLGVLRVTKLKHLLSKSDNIESLDLNPCEKPVSIEQSLLDIYQITTDVIDTPRTEKEFYKASVAGMLTMNRSHQGIDNMYFRIPIDLASVSTLKPTKYKAMESIIAEPETIETEILS